MTLTSGDMTYRLLRWLSTWHKPAAPTMENSGRGVLLATDARGTEVVIKVLSTTDCGAPMREIRCLSDAQASNCKIPSAFNCQL
jgi:hypothetical protein